MTTRIEIVNDFLAINAKAGTDFQAIAESSGSSIPFGCRDGECGTCIINVESGAEFLTPKNDKEKAVLAKICCQSDKARLTCQMKIEKPNGVVRLKY
jgi:ferredoxin